MYVRVLLLTVLSTQIVMCCEGQTSPRLKSPGTTDTQLTGTAQGITDTYVAVDLTVCAAPSLQAPLDCTQKSADPRRQSLPNLGATPFSMNGGSNFTIALTKALPPGMYVWIVEIVHVKNGAKTEPTVLIGKPVLVRLPILDKASLSLSGTDSASRDAGAKATLDLIRGVQGDRWGQTLFLGGATYDDKWKSKPLSANVTQNYSGRLSEMKLFGSATASAWGGDAVVYHNNTQGIRVEQVYGVDISHEFLLPDSVSLQVAARPQAMIETLYSPGQSVTVGGINLGADLDHRFANGDEADIKLAGTPVFDDSDAWTADGDFSLIVPLGKHWSIQFEVVDNYYEIAPKTFNKNYLEPALGISFK